MKQNHPHKYLRVNIGSTKDKPYFVYKCVDNCSHFIHESMILGREAACWQCAQPFKIVRLKKKKPICEDCWNRLYHNDAESILKGIGVI